MNDFSLNPGQAWIEENQMFGISNIKKEERKQDILFPTTTLEFPMNAYNFSLIAWLCYQSGVSEAGASAYVKTLIPYTSPECEVWASIIDPVTGAITSGNNEAIHGAIVKSFTVSGEQGGQMKISAEFIGRAYSQSFSDGDGVLTVSEQTGLLYKNMNVSLDGNTIYVPSISITFTNNAVSIPYNTTNVLKHLLKKASITGDLPIPRDSGTAGEDAEAQITDLLAGDDKRLQINFGGNNPATTAGDWALDMDILYKSKEKVVEPEVGNRLPFEQIAGSNNLSCSWADGIDRTI